MTNITRFNPDDPSTTITGYAIENGRPVLVELLDSEGPWRTVQAFEGEPFQAAHYGYTDLVTILADKFQPLFQPLSARPYQAPQPKRITLLDMALAAARDAWPSGEVVYVWGDPRRGPGQYAYLKEGDKGGPGLVKLYIGGIDGAGCPIFQLYNNGWAPLVDVTKRYQGWMTRIKSEVVK